MHKRKPQILQFLRKRLPTTWVDLLSLRRKQFIGFSHFKHNFNLFLFVGIRKYFMTDKCEFISCNFPNIGLFPMNFGSLGRGIARFQTPKCVMQSVNKSYISINNLYGGSEISSSSLFVKGVRSDINTSFSIDDACQICKMYFRKIFDHVKSVLDYWSIIQHDFINVQAERLSEKTPKGDAIV
jgi:hypothetical protein